MGEGEGEGKNSRLNKITSFMITMISCTLDFNTSEDHSYGNNISQTKICALSEMKYWNNLKQRII